MKETRRRKRIKRRRKKEISLLTTNKLIALHHPLPFFILSPLSHHLYHPSPLFIPLQCFLSRNRIFQNNIIKTMISEVRKRRRKRRDFIADITFCEFFEDVGRLKNKWRLG
jgi:hypothetical protein